MKNNLFIPRNWIEEHILKLENYSGGIDELSRKISNIRTWTYISNQSDWLKDKLYWQEKTRDIEDNLSEYLHESLTNRFIDISISHFIKLLILTLDLNNYSLSKKINFKILIYVN